jgi:hypothetical protein
LSKELQKNKNSVAITLSPFGVGVKKTRLSGGGLLCIFILCYYTLAPPPCSAGMTMTTTIIIAVAIVSTLYKLLFNIEIECTVNVRLPGQINKELFKKDGRCRV